MKKLWMSLVLLAPMSVFADLNQVAQMIATNPKAGFEVSTQTSKEPITIEIYNADGKVAATANASPEDFVSAVRTLIPARSLKSSGYNYKIEWNKMSFTAETGEKSLYDILTDIKDHQSEPDSQDFINGYLSEDFKVLSVVGSIVSVRTTGSNYYPGAAHPNYWDSFITFDMKKVNSADGDMRANLVGLVDEQSLLQALKADKALAKLVSDKTVKKQILAAKTMLQFTEAIGFNVDNCYSFPGYDGEMSSFAIYDYDAKLNLVWVRVAMGAAAHVCAAEAPTIQLGLKVKPNAEFEKVLRLQAQQRDGLLMKNVK
jgi:hypothetical protein